MKNLFNKFSTGEFKTNESPLSKNQKIVLAVCVLLTIVLKLFLIPYNMIDMGDSATRVWNAFWWSQEPFVVLPEHGHPFWFYFMGPLMMLTKEFFYTSIVSMILVMSFAGIYIFRITYLFSDFKTSMIAFFVFTLNPVIFRLNFEPYAQQTYLAALCVMVYYLIVGITSENSKKNLIIAGLFSFVALASRPEAIFVIAPFCLLAFLSKKKGCSVYLFLSLSFQLIWIIISLIKYGTPFQTIMSADQYTEDVNIQGLALGMRAKGFFLPYYFLFFGLTIFLFWFFIKGFLLTRKRLPLVLTLSLLLPILVPALVNGLAGAKSSIYHTTHYIYAMFFFAPIFGAIGLSNFTEKYSKVVQIIVVPIVILTCIPLSYVKDFVPQKFNKLFPKVIQFIVTAEDPQETWKLIYAVDKYIPDYPSLIFDAEGSVSSIFYVPFRTKLPAKPINEPKIFISGYNVPTDANVLGGELGTFMSNNPKSLVIIKKGNTALNQIFAKLIRNKQVVKNGLKYEWETDKWFILTYDVNLKE